MDKRKILFQKIQYIFAVILNVLLIFTISDSDEQILTLKGGMLFIPVILWIGQLVLFGLETKFKSNKIRMLFLIVATLIILLNIPDLELVAFSIMFFSIIYLFMLIFSSKENFKYKKVAENNEIKKSLSIGHFSKKHSKIVNTTLLLSFVAAVIIYILLFELLNLDFFSSFIIVYLILFIAIIITNKLSNPFIKALTKFNKNLNFDLYEQEINKLLENDLHPESRNYLKLMYVNYLYMVDLYLATIKFDELYRPQFKAYQIEYDLIEVVNAINLNDEEKARELLEKYETNHKRYKRNIVAMKLLIEIYFTENEITNIKSYYPITDKNLLVVNIVNSNALMTYFNRRGYIEEAKFYANYIIENASSLKQIVTDAKKILETCNE